MEPQHVTPSVPPPPVDQQKPPHSNKMFKVLLLVFLVLLLGAVVTHAFQSYKPQRQSDLLPKPEDVQSPTPEQANKWNVYRNEKYGFEFNYDNDHQAIESPVVGNQFILMIVAEKDAYETGFVPIQLLINNTADEKGNPYKLTSIKQAETHYSKSFTSDSLKRDDILLNGEFAITISGLTKGSGPGEGSYMSYTFVELNDDILVFQLGDKNYQPVFNQILSSFRFVDENQSLTKECANSTLKISLQIPNDWTCDSQIQSKTDGWINMESEEFKITIGNLGRGGPCGETAESDKNCKKELFFTSTSKSVGLTNYFDSNVDGYEIFGSVNNSSKPMIWVSIQPKDTKMKAPSTSGATLLKEVFETLQVTQ